MKKSSNPVSPFLALLIPALLAVGYHHFNKTEIEPEKQQASVYFQVPSLKNLIKAVF
jgi:hypothetical protein